MAVNFATIDKLIEEGFLMDSRFNSPAEIASLVSKSGVCLLYTSDAADEL